MSVVITRAAVVIGVNKTGGLTPLKAAVSGAQQIQRWLEAEKFDVKGIFDTDGPVTISEVKKAVRRYVELRTVRQLVIFFAGHGYLNDSAEVWLLSGAPEDPSDAINQTASAEYARTCGIPSVVMISDACRSRPPSRQAGLVTGSPIFPNLTHEIDVEVDRFYATNPGDPAFELSVDDARRKYDGLFTRMLQQIHIDPGQDLVRTVRIDGQNTVVVPNRRLKEVLPDYVNDAAQARSITLVQKPQLRLECGEETFVAHAIFTRVPSGLEPDQGPPPRRDQRKASEIGLQGPLSIEPPNFAAYGDGLEAALRAPTLQHDAERVRQADQTGQFETQAGVEVTGAQVAWAAGLDLDAEVDAHDPRRILLHAPGQRNRTLRGPGTVILQFENGFGTVVAGLPGYVAAVKIESGRVVNVSYVPSQNSALWEKYKIQKEQAEKLRAAAAVAARNGILAVARDEARSFADRVRQLKKFDPTLGMYAALAYADVGLRKEVQSVQNYMRGDLRVDLFDVALLAGPPRQSLLPSRRIFGWITGRPEYPVVPFCPMLSQSWSFLGPRGVELPQGVMKAGYHRRPALWTTFEAEGMALLRALTVDWGGWNGSIHFDPGSRARAAREEVG